MKHRKYKLLYSSDTYSVVMDILNETEQKCFRLDYNEGDEIYLFEKGINISNGNKIFEFSIKNLYEEGCHYEFEIVGEAEKCLIVSNNQYLRFGIPFSFREDITQTTIELEIEQLDLEHNKIRFKAPKGDKANENDDYSIFEFDKSYLLPIQKCYYNRKQILFAVLEYDNKQFNVSIPSYLNESDLGKELEVHLGYYKDSNKLILKVARSFIANKLYKPNVQYKFKIEQQFNDTESGIIKWILIDMYNIHHNYYPANDLTYSYELATLKEGDEIDLYVIKISDKGFLDLGYKIYTWNYTHYLIEDIFDAIGYPNQEDKYFFRDKQFLEKNLDVSTPSERSYIDQYNDGENLWVFSYLTYLDDEIIRELEKGNYEEAMTLIDIYIKFEKWILEGSNYLKNFSTFKSQDIIKKAESKLDKLEAVKAAIELYRDGKEQAFLEEINLLFSRSTYLNKTKKNILKQLVIVSQYFAVDTDQSLYKTLLHLIKYNYVSDEERKTYSKSIETKVNSLKEKLLDGNNVFNDEKKHELECIISYQYLIVCLNASPHSAINACTSSILLLRFMSLYYNDVRYLDLAIKMITSTSYIHPNLSIHYDIFKISYEELEKLVHVGDANTFGYGKSGLLYFHNYNIDILPKNLNRSSLLDKKYPVLENYQNLALSVFTSFDLPQIDNQINETELIKNIITLVNYKKVIESEKVSFDKGQRYIGRIKDVMKDDLFCFVSIKVHGVLKDALLHMNGFHKCRIFDRIDEILNKNDYLNLNILNIDEDGKVIIDLENIIEEYANVILDNGELETTGIVVKKFERLTFIISKEGWPIRVCNCPYPINTTVSCIIKKYDGEYHIFEGYQVEEMDFVIQEEPSELYRAFLKSCGVMCERKHTLGMSLVDSPHIIDNDEEQVTELILKGNSYKYVVIQLISCLEQRLTFVDNSRDLAVHYLLLNLICSSLNNGKSYLYYIKLIELAKIIAFIYPDEFKSFNIPELNDSNKATHYTLKNQLLYQLLSYLNTSHKEIPIEIDANSKFYILKKMIEAYNLFYEIDNTTPILNQLKVIISNQLRKLHLYNKGDHSEELRAIVRESFYQESNSNNYISEKITTNLGSESQTKEFKSSIFFSASDEPQARVILKTIAGFLNAYQKGGSLYIGVNDSGDIIGLNKDLIFNENISNLDKYQNYLQDLVSSSFPKEINALLEYKFHKVGKRDYLEIIIPSHDKPIPYENEFYQRQGVQTRILKGNDLIDFIKRKTTQDNNKTNDPSLLLAENDNRIAMEGNGSVPPQS